MSKVSREKAIDTLNHYRTPDGEPLTSSWEASKLSLRALNEIEEDILPLLYAGVDQLLIASRLQDILDEV